MNKITVRLSSAAQRDAARAGLPAQRDQSYELPSTLVGVALDLGAVVAPDGAVVLDGYAAVEDAYRTESGGGGGYDGSLHARPASASDALAAIRAACDLAAATAVSHRRDAKAREEARVAEERAKAEKWAALPLAWRVSPQGVCTCTGAQDGKITGPLMYTGYTVVAHDTVRKYAPDAWAEAAAEFDRLRARIEARKAETEAKEREERDAWIAAHGSERLRLARECEFPCDAIYRDERLSKERPGWTWELHAPVGQTYGEEAPPRNPTLVPLQALRSARAAGIDATLVYVPRWTRDPDEKADRDGDVPLPGIYVLAATFLGRPIRRVVDWTA